MAVEYLPTATIQRFYFTTYVGTRVVTDGVTTNTSTTLTSATAAFSSFDVGAAITGTGIPGGATIASVTNATTVVLSAAATATGSGVSVTIARTTANGLAGFQAALIADWGASGTISAQLPSTFQVLVNSNAPTVALVLVNANLILSVPRDSVVGFNQGSWQVLTAAALAASYTAANV
jgi:hypothetical protein